MGRKTIKNAQANDEQEKQSHEDISARKQPKIQSFFHTTPKITRHFTLADSSTASNRFLPFELKEDMLLCVEHRRPPLTDVQRFRFTTDFSNQSAELADLYLGQLKADYKIGTSSRTLIQIGNEISVLGNVTTNGSKMKAKLLQFEHSYRPPYYGTWRKKSSLVTGRRPFGREKMLDYDIDSDDEWEEDDVDAEDCNSENDEEILPPMDDDDNDGFLVEHGYLSDDEGVSDEDAEHMDPEMRRARMEARAETWKSERRVRMERDKTRLVSFVHGPCWDYSKVDKPIFDKIEEYRASSLQEIIIITVIIQFRIWQR